MSPVWEHMQSSLRAVGLVVNKSAFNGRRTVCKKIYMQPVKVLDNEDRKKLSHG